MLKDRVRTEAYRRAIRQNAQLFQGKVVLDIGCGTGILSMFAAAAGARLVIGVDMSGMIDHAKKIIAANNFSDRIVLIKGKMEQVTLPVDSVDVIISEWMGYFLLYESMLDTVLWARDRYLKADGAILPNRTVLYLTAIEDAQYRHEKIEFWHDVYGYDMSCLEQWALREPLVDTVEGKATVCKACPIYEIDIAAVKVCELEFSSAFSLTIDRQDIVHAFVGYFDALFQQKTQVSFSTGPNAPYTHWKQTVFYLESPIAVEKGDLLTGTISVGKNKRNHRELDIFITFSHNGGDEITQSYHMC